MIEDEIPFLASATTTRATKLVADTGALASVETALRRAYAVSVQEDTSFGKSRPVELELTKDGWRKVRVWYPGDLPRPANDSFDGWRVFRDERGSPFGIAVEVEFSWNRVFFDLLKLWRGQHSGQIAAGIVVLRDKSSYHYAQHHQFAPRDLSVVFCALDAPGLSDPTYLESKSHTVIPMPADPA